MTFELTLVPHEETGRRMVGSGLQLQQIPRVGRCWPCSELQHLEHVSLLLPCVCAEAAAGTAGALGRHEAGAPHVAAALSIARLLLVVLGGDNVIQTGSWSTCCSGCRAETRAMQRQHRLQGKSNLQGAGRLLSH